MNFPKKSITITLVICLTFAVVSALIIEQITREPIAQATINKHRNTIEQMMPLPYTNDLFTDNIEIHSLGGLGTSEAVQIYRARHPQKTNAHQGVGLVITPTAPDGYNAPIKLALSLNYQGEILKIHILQHQETKDFGAKIHQDETDWLERFSGKSAHDFEQKNNVDQISGASVSSHAVTEAIRKCVNLYQRNPELFWATTNEW